MGFIAAIPILGKLLDKVIPDKNARAAAQELLLAFLSSGPHHRVGVDLVS